MAVELAPLGIRVMGVAPTLVITPGIEEKKPLFEAAGIDIISHTESILPLGRIPTRDDVARIVVFAASDLAASMTGSLLLADAGAMAL
jgi:NAD(P)-dependent dehydrogenase (short-subunit alcohol dehydrogenase family)